MKRATKKLRPKKIGPTLKEVVGEALEERMQKFERELAMQRAERQAAANAVALFYTRREEYQALRDARPWWKWPSALERYTEELMGQAWRASVRLQISQATRPTLTTTNAPDNFSYAAAATPMNWWWQTLDFSIMPILERDKTVLKGTA